MRSLVDVRDDGALARNNKAKLRPPRAANSALHSLSAPTLNFDVWNVKANAPESRASLARLLSIEEHTNETRAPNSR